MTEYLNRVHHGDCLAVMADLPSACVDLVVTSPPYNLREGVGSGNGWKSPKNRKWHSAKLPGEDEGKLPGQTHLHPVELLNEGYDGHTDDLPHQDYVAWQRECLSAMMRLLKPDGAIFYNHKWRVQGGILQDRADIVEGFPVRQVIIWQRGGGLNFNEGYFLPTYEVIYLIAQPKFRLLPKGNAVGDVWKIVQDQANPHPAPMPLTVAQRCIGATGAQVVLDPFLGSGTTAVAAIRSQREWIGIEKSGVYCALAEERIAKELRQPFLL